MYQEYPSSTALTALIYGVGVIVATWLYYRYLKLQNLATYSKPYSIILLFMIGIMLTNMAISICNPPNSDTEPINDVSKIMTRVGLMISYMLIINIMVRDYNRTHTATSKVVQNILIIITVAIMIITVVIWVPQSDVMMTRAIRDIISVTFTIAMGYLVILIIDIIKRGGQSQTPSYLIDALDSNFVF